MDADIPPTLQARWSRVETQQPPVDATVRPDLGIAQTAPGSQAVEPPPRLGVSLADDRADTTEGELEILGTLGAGGMSTVLLARQKSLRREVAVKAAIEGDARSASALLAEGVITGALEHPSIVPVHLLGVDDDGRPAMVMKRIQGVTWSALIDDPAHEGWAGWSGTPDDRLPGHVQILTSICNALHFAHSRGWVHRDIKPANVLIGQFGDVYLADWGIAARMGSVAEAVCGTPGYLPPEMAKGDKVDERSDVYLLGACLHQALVGRLRHAAPTALGAVALSLVSLPFSYPDWVPFELGELANQSCHLEPEQRIQSAVAFRDALDDYTRHRESVALARDAAAILGELEQAPRGLSTSVEERAVTDRLQARAGFAIERALQTWPGNPVAIGAHEQLESILTERRAREASLAREARQRDPTIAGGTRVAILAVGAALTLAISTFSMSFGWPGDPRVGLVGYPALLWLVAVAITIAYRGRVLSTDYNRKVAATVLILFGFVPLQRTVGALAGLPLTQIYALDAFVFAAGLAIYGVTQQRWAFWVSLLSLASGIGTLLLPEQVLYTFGFPSVFGVALAAGLSFRDWRIRSRQP